MSRPLLEASPAAPPTSASLRNLSNFLFCWRARVALLGAGVTIVACGVQGPPHPPRLEQPAAVQDFSAAQKGRTFTLSFTLPRQATDGEGLSKPLEIEIFRVVSPPNERQPEPSLLPPPWRILEPTDLGRYATGDKIYFTVELSDSEYARDVGANFTFAVRGLTRGFRHRPVLGEFSNLTRARLLNVSAPVGNLGVQATEKALDLKWSPPTRGLASGFFASLTGYRVYRSATGRDFQLRAETTGPNYSDPDFRFDHTYFYKVGAIFKGEGSVAESEDSLTVAITPRDIFPPAPPRDISALYAAGAVEIVWRANSEPDLAGYNVYRSGTKGSPGERLNRGLLKTPIFRDAAAAPDRTYFYHLTAVDMAGNKSGSSTEVAVETR